MTMPPPPQPPTSSRRPLVIGLAALVVGALLLSVLAVAVVIRLTGGGTETATEAPETTAAPVVAPSPMTEVTTEHYTFSYPEHWQPGEDVDNGSMTYSLSLIDAVENSKTIVMDYPVMTSVEEACEGLSNSGSFPYERVDDVEIDGRATLHYQGRDEDTQGRERVQDIWCAPRDTSIVAILGRTAGPEAVEAGVSEAQKVLDSWTWTGE